MSDPQRLIKSLIASPGYQILTEKLSEEIADVYERIISMPDDKLTTRTASRLRGEITAFRRLRDWLSSQEKI